MFINRKNAQTRKLNQKWPDLLEKVNWCKSAPLAVVTAFAAPHFMHFLTNRLALIVRGSIESN